MFKSLCKSIKEVGNMLIIISLFPSTLYYIRKFEKKIYNGNGDS